MEARSGFPFFLTLFVSLAISAVAAPPKDQLSTASLAQGITGRRARVAEFEFIRQEAERQGIRVWLFGGTAASFAHYVKRDMERENSDLKLPADPYDYSYTNIYRSNQDMDIVIDGSPEQVAHFQTLLQEKFPYFQGAKSTWEVRSLRWPLNQPNTPGYKEALLEDFDFLNQNTDSNSTGMIELTPHPASEPTVRDLRNWKSHESVFLDDVSTGKLHYYLSPNHHKTSRARNGTNPPIVSVVRALIKMVQFGLTADDQSLSSFRRIIREFEPRELQPVVRAWMEKNARKLIQNAIDVENAAALIDELGLKDKIIKAGNGDARAMGSMAWWLSKEPLKTKPVGEGDGKTALEIAGELGVPELIVSHETSGFQAYESIMASPLDLANVFKSRSGMPGENASEGDGFYARPGRYGGRGTGYTVRLVIRPEAREKTDFIRGVTGDFILLNKAAFKVIRESLAMAPREFFERLARGEMLGADEKGALENLRRRVARGVALSNEDQRYIDDLATGELAKKEKLNLPLVLEWTSLPHMAARKTQVWIGLAERFFSARDLNGLMALAGLVASQRDFREHESFLELLQEKAFQATNLEYSDHVALLSHIARATAWPRGSVALKRSFIERLRAMDKQKAAFVLDEVVEANFPAANHDPQMWEILRLIIEMTAEIRTQRNLVGKLSFAYIDARAFTNPRLRRSGLGPPTPEVREFETLQNALSLAGPTMVKDYLRRKLGPYSWEKAGSRGRPGNRFSCETLFQDFSLFMLRLLR